MKTIDTHAHMKINENIKYFLQKMRDNNFGVILIGTDEASLKENKILSKENNFIFNTVGIHPLDISYFDTNTINTMKLFIDKNTLAIGEIGLDYHYPLFDKEKQILWFKNQIDFSIENNLPIVVHTRDSLIDTFKILKKYRGLRILLHSWSGNSKETKQFLELNHEIYFSYNGILTFKNAKLQQEVIKIIPLDRLMFETDSPFLSPEPYRGKENNPLRVEVIIRFASILLNMSFNDINNLNNKNSQKFFGLEKDIFDN